MQEPGRLIAVRVPGRNPALCRRLCTSIAVAWGSHPAMRDAAALVTAGADGRSPRPLAESIHRWCRDEIRFLPEPGEQIQTPGLTLRRRFGDCDDQATLVAALLLSVRVSCRLMLLAEPAVKSWRRSLVSIGPDDAVGKRRAFHIWTQAFVDGVWLDLETCDPRARFGEHPADLMRRIGILL